MLQYNTKILNVPISPSLFSSPKFTHIPSKTMYKSIRQLDKCGRASNGLADKHLLQLTCSSVMSTQNLCSTVTCVISLYEMRQTDAIIESIGLCISVCLGHKCYISKYLNFMADYYLCMCVHLCAFALEKRIETFVYSEALSLYDGHTTPLLLGHDLDHAHQHILQDKTYTDCCSLSHTAYLAPRVSFFRSAMPDLKYPCCVFLHTTRWK